MRSNNLFISYRKIDLYHLGRKLAMDFKSLYYDTWMDDEVMNSYSQLVHGMCEKDIEELQPTCAIYTTFFVSKLVSNFDDWEQKTTMKPLGNNRSALFDNKYIIIPVNQIESHW